MKLENMPSLIRVWTTVFLTTCLYELVFSYVNKKNFSKTDHLAEKILSCKNVTAISLAVFSLEDDKYITRQYGYANLETKNTLSEHTLFGIGSVTKTFTSLLLGKLLKNHPQYHHLGFDTPVKDILGRSFDMDDALVREYATVRDLLSHRTGLADYNYIKMKGNFTIIDLLRKMKYFKRIGPFRSFLYNNIMYCLLAYVTEKLGEDTWENLMQKHIFNPLNMTSTTFTSKIKPGTRVNMAMPYLRDKDGNWKAVDLETHRQWGKLGGSGSIVSNLVDMVKWMKLHLNALSLDPRKRRLVNITDISAIEETHSGVVNLPHSNFHVKETYTWTSYGLGWVNAFYREFPIIVSSGNSWGYTAELTLIPPLSTGIYVSTTGSDEHYEVRRALHLHIMDHLLGERQETKDIICNVNKPLEQPRYENKQLEITRYISSRYEGTYWNDIFTKIEIYYNKTNSKLHMKYGTLGTWDLVPVRNLKTFNAYGIQGIPSLNIKIQFVSSESSGINARMSAMEISNLVHDDPQIFTRANARVQYAYNVSGQKSCYSVYDSLLSLFMCITFAHFFVCGR